MVAQRDAQGKFVKSFTTEVKGFAKAFHKDVSEVVQFAGLQIYSAAVQGTPVDTGIARASWRMTQDTVDPSVATTPQQTSIAAIEAKLQTPNNAADTTYFITNNLKYIVPLERGHSKQAPRGMLLIATRNFRKFMNDAVRALKKKR